MIKEDEGHGRKDGKIVADKISDYVECRFEFPQFPLNRTVFIKGMSKDLTDEEVIQRKNDLKKIKKFLIRQTSRENDEESEIICHLYNTFMKLGCLQVIRILKSLQRVKKMRHIKDI